MSPEVKTTIAHVFAVLAALATLFGIDAATDLNVLQNETVIGLGAAAAAWAAGKDLAGKIRARFSK